MKVHDLKTGDVIVTRDEDEYLVLYVDSRLWAVGVTNYMDLYTHNDDMTYLARHNLDIMQVYRGAVDSISNMLNTKGRKLIYDREKKEMTLSEIEDVLGYKVKVVDKHD